LRNVFETLAISTQTVIESARGTVTHEACNRRLESWSIKVVNNLELTLTVSGREHLGGSHHLVMSNHQSHYDIPVLFAVLGSNMRMVTKAELFRIPVFGPALRAAGFVSIDRGRRDRAVASLADARSLLNTGMSVWLAPEGTRSPSVSMLPFKKGGFHLAQDAGVPILPVAIRGTHQILSRCDARSLSKVSVNVTIMKAIDPSTFPAKAEGRALLMDAVRRAIQEGLIEP
jgi:1-acyl-sn-glycerol-3-phosphate acyltransferase